MAQKALTGRFTVAMHKHCKSLPSQPRAGSLWTLKSGPPSGQRPGDLSFSVNGEAEQSLQSPPLPLLTGRLGEGGPLLTVTAIDSLALCPGIGPILYPVPGVEGPRGGQNKMLAATRGHHG